MLSNGTIDGFIVWCLKRKNQDYNHFSAIIVMTPIVMFDRIAEGGLCDKVVVDDFDSTYCNTAY
jgi:LacI family transcriptional regulator